jgi:hypothetical protein
VSRQPPVDSTTSACTTCTAQSPQEILPKGEASPETATTGHKTRSNVRSLSIPLEFKAKTHTTARRGEQAEDRRTSIWDKASDPGLVLRQCHTDRRCSETRSNGSIDTFHIEIDSGDPRSSCRTSTRLYARWDPFESFGQRKGDREESRLDASWDED